jgi:hypothetical protein
MVTRSLPIFRGAAPSGSHLAEHSSERWGGVLPQPNHGCSRGTLEVSTPIGKSASGIPGYAPAAVVLPDRSGVPYIVGGGKGIA